MYSYIFSFTLILTTTLLQKLATFHDWNVKQKDDGMGQNTLHCCYGEYVTTGRRKLVDPPKLTQDVNYYRCSQICILSDNRKCPKSTLFCFGGLA